MAIQIPSKFMKFQLTPEEETAAKVFAPLNLMWLQNLRSEWAEKKLNVKVDPEDIKDFVQQEAYIQGKLELLNELLGD